MKCPHCGKWTYAKVCPRCGETLIPDEPAARTPAVYTYNASNNPPRPAYTRAKPAAPSPAASAPAVQDNAPGDEDGMLCVSEELFNAVMTEHEQDLSDTAMPGANDTLNLAPIEHRQELVSTGDRFQRSEQDPVLPFLITTGHEAIHANKFTLIASLRRNVDGLLYFDKVPGFFLVEYYNWAGPRYEEVTTGKAQTNYGGKDKTKRKGGLLGAAVGTVLLPGVGTAIGYAATSRKETVYGGKDTTKNTSVTTTRELNAPAKLMLRNIDTGAQIVLGFSCTSALDMRMSSFLAPCPQQPPAPPPAEPAPTPAPEQAAAPSAVQQLKDLKELLDLGIVTQEEFDAKKKELLGL